MLFYGSKDRRFRVIVLATVKGQGYVQLSMRRLGGQYWELINNVTYTVGEIEKNGKTE